ncbi:uncharacterized protein LOC122048289 [Zingiber officinale]|uniref:uncharacterized protein LOC122048289 n=1 Tax=Zingiber officinale TaxID=94328 RepID=UPI001C4C8E41|nr:uncharacterized protein LOC122048289 [Zingiber officinale]
MQDSQIVQIASSSSRAPGQFRGKPDVNPMEHCNRIELRSEWTLGDPQVTTPKGMKLQEELSPPTLEPIQIHDDEENTKKVEETFPLNPQSQTIPFLKRLVMTKKDKEFSRFLDKVKDICVELSLIDVIQQMPKFVKFLKDVMPNRRRKGDIEIVTLTEECNTIFEKNTSPKLQDPGSFYIPCTIGSEFIEKVFCDLGESVPYGYC